jgi:WhiB family transcriptional regulator, redox-sensing transcriptional regulator
VSSEDDFDPWWRDGLCAEIGPDLFFVGQSQSGFEAKQVCRLCPVRAKCLADALATDVEHGIFGGMARPTRRALRVRVEQGADPMKVAEAAIKREKKTKARVTWAR